MSLDWSLNKLQAPSYVSRLILEELPGPSNVPILDLKRIKSF